MIIKLEDTVTSSKGSAMLGTCLLIFLSVPPVHHVSEELDQVCVVGQVAPCKQVRVDHALGHMRICFEKIMWSIHIPKSKYCYVKYSQTFIQIMFCIIH